MLGWFRRRRVVREEQKTQDLRLQIAEAQEVRDRAQRNLTDLRDEMKRWRGEA